RVELLAGLEQFQWKERITYIIFDSDAAANENVRMAAQSLGHQLVKRGAKVHLGYLPSAKGKVGMDDYLLTHSKTDFEEFLKSVPEVVSSKALHDMNNLVTYVRASPGFIYVNRTKERITPSDFKSHQFSDHQYMLVKEKPDGTVRTEVRQTADDWLKWPHRAVVDRVIYEPGLPEYVDGSLNTWPGYAVEPKKGDITPWRQMLD